MMRTSYAIVLSLLLSSAAAGEGSRGDWMTASELTASFSGRTIDGLYSNGESFTETYQPGGRIDYRERARNLSGRWSVEAGAFCTIYDVNPTGGCFRVRQMSANCFEFYFIARSESEASLSPGRPSWTARGWYKGKPPTCEEGANV